MLSKQRWRDDNAAERQELSRRDGEKRSKEADSSL